MHAESVLYICILFPFAFAADAAGAVTTIRKHYVDVHRNLTLKCPLQNNGGGSVAELMWIREGRDDAQEVPRLVVLEDGMLLLLDVDRNDAGIYACTSNESGVVARMDVVVRTPPPPLINVHVHVSTILAVILWGVSGTGGYPINYFTAQYKPVESLDDWLDITPIHIMPSSRQIDVYKLLPNTTYAFRVWAVNRLGESEISVVYQTTRISNETAELVRHFFEGAAEFDPRVWLLAVVIVMGTLIVLGLGTCFLLYQECRSPGEVEDQEVIELVPNIILNPGFVGNEPTAANGTHATDENYNRDSTTMMRPHYSCSSNA